MSKKRILFLYEGINVGGIWSSFKNLLIFLSKQENVEVTVMFLNETNFNLLPTNIHYVTCGELSRKTNRSGILRLLQIIKNGQLQAWVICRLFKKNRKLYIPALQKFEYMEAMSKPEIDLREKYDFVISFCEMYTNYLVANKIKARRKICWIHPDYCLAKFDTKYDVKAFRKVDWVITVSKSNTEYLIKKIGKKCDCSFETIENIIDSKEICKKSMDFCEQFDSKVINLITVARLDNISKAFDRTIKILGKIKKEGIDNFCWRILGDGQDRARILRLIKKNNLLDNVYLLGKKDNPFPYVKQSDLMLLLSKYEGKPVSVEESLILGTPCMVTNFPSSYEVIKEGLNGFIVKNNSRDIYLALKEVLGNYNCLNGLQKNDFSFSPKEPNRLLEIIQENGRND